MAYLGLENMSQECWLNLILDNIIMIRFND